MLLNRTTEKLEQQFRDEFNLKDIPVSKKIVTDRNVEFRFQIGKRVITVRQNDIDEASLIYELIAENKRQYIPFDEFKTAYDDYKDVNDVTDDNYDTAVKTIIKGLTDGRLPID